MEERGSLLTRDKNCYRPTTRFLRNEMKYIGYRHRRILTYYTVYTYRVPKLASPHEHIVLKLLLVYQ